MPRWCGLKKEKEKKNQFRQFLSGIFICLVERCIVCVLCVVCCV